MKEGRKEGWVVVGGDKRENEGKEIRKEGSKRRFRRERRKGREDVMKDQGSEGRRDWVGGDKGGKDERK